jgi:hypothetical protein
MPARDVVAQATAAEAPNGLAQEAQKASGFADWSEGNVQGLSAEAAAQRDALRRLATGQDSYSAEQLRQNLGQNLAAQQSMAAGARPGNSAMAALNASQNAMRLGSGLAGQQALAGIQERQAAQDALSKMILGERGQDVTGALGSRSNAIQGYIGKNQQDNQPSGFMRVLGGIAPILGALSDKRAKKNIKKGDGDAKRALDSLKAYTYDYKDEKHGKGRQFGVMAQDLEKAGLKHAVRETRRSARSSTAGSCRSRTPPCSPSSAAASASSRAGRRDASRWRSSRRSTTRSGPRRTGCSGQTARQ